MGVFEGDALTRGVGLGLGLGLELGVAVGLGDAVGAIVGGALGGRVGGAVGGGVGGGVGRGVGVGGGGGAVVGAGPITVIVPFMNVWKVQWYAYVPAAVNASVLPPWGAIAPVSNAPVSDVAVCSSGSLFSQLTLSPTLIVTFAGTNVKFWMVTVWIAAQAGMVRDALARTTAAATRSARVSRVRRIR